MDYKELIKKYWFVALIGVLLIVFIGVYAMDAYKNRELTVQSKDVDGKSAVYSVDGEYVLADDFFNSLYQVNGLSSEFTAFQRAVLNSAYETTDDMNTLATSNAAYAYQQYGEPYIVSILQSMGYTNGSDDLVDYYIDSQKSNLLTSDYLKAHEAEYITPYQTENDGRVIYHILVKVADVASETDADGNTTYTANPTEEESKKLQDILEALKTKPFQEVAAEYSDDSSAQSGGYIGYIGKANGTNYYPVFTEASMKLANDEVSEPITSQAGYHIIWNAGSSTETLLNDNSFLTLLLQDNPTISLRSVMDKAKELNYEIVDETLSNMIKAQLESGETE